MRLIIKRRTALC